MTGLVATRAPAPSPPVASPAWLGRSQGHDAGCSRQASVVRRPGERRVLGSVRVRAALALGVLVAPLGVNTMAYWSSRVVIAPGAVQAGTFDLKVNGGDQQVALGLDVVDMAPNTSTAAVVTLSNASSGDNAVMTYTVDATTVDTAPTGTGAALTAKVTTASAVTTSGTGKTCQGTVVPSSSSFAGTLVGTPQALPSGQSRTLCIQANLGPTAPAGGRTTITVTFKAVQKDPNP